MCWARQSQHPQKRAAGTAPSRNRGVSPRMRKVALQQARIAVNTSTLTTRSSDSRVCKSQHAFSSSDAAVQSRASTLGARQVGSLKVAKFRTRSLPPERRNGVLAVATSIKIPAWLMQMSLFNRPRVLMAIEICRAALAMSQNPIADPKRLHSSVSFASETDGRFAVIA